MNDEELDTVLAKIKKDTNIALTKEELEDNPTAPYLDASQSIPIVIGTSLSRLPNNFIPCYAIRNCQ